MLPDFKYKTFSVMWGEKILVSLISNPSSVSFNSIIWELRTSRHTADNDIRVWDEQGTCAFFTEQVVVKSVKVSKIAQREEGILGERSEA